MSEPVSQQGVPQQAVSQQSVSQPPSSSALPRRRNPIGTILLALFLIALLAVGGFFYRLSHQNGPAHVMAEKFLRDVAAGKMDDVKDMCTSDVDIGALERLSAKQKTMWGNVTNIDTQATVSRTFKGMPCTSIAGEVAYEHLPVEGFSITIVQQPEGSLKIAEYNFEQR